MEPKARELVTAIYAQWNQGNWALERFHSDVEWAPGGEAFDETEPSRGLDSLARYWARFWAAWKPGARWEIDDLESHGDDLLASGRLFLVGRSSGLEAEFPVFHLWTVRDGMVVRLLVCDDRDTALRAVRS